MFCLRILHQIHGLQKFFPVILSAVTFEEQEVLRFDDVHFISFYFTDCAFDVTAAQSSSNQR